MGASPPGRITNVNLPHYLPSCLSFFKTNLFPLHSKFSIANRKTNLNVEDIAMRLRIHHTKHFKEMIKTTKAAEANRKATIAATNEVEETVENTTVATVEDNEIFTEGELSCKIVRVLTAPNDPKRLMFVTNQEFETINNQSGEYVVTSSFSKNIREVVNQVAKFIPELQLAEVLAMGSMVNPLIISLAMVNADIVIDRTIKHQGDEREYKVNGVTQKYDNDAYLTTFVKVKPNINPLFATQLEKLIATQPAMVTVAARPSATSYLDAE